jgi:hypothetical protein
MLVCKIARTLLVDVETKPALQLAYPEAELVLGLVYSVGTDYTGYTTHARELR